MAYFDTKSGSLEESIRKAVINEEPKMDKVNPDAVKKKFKDRKDKDIDNDGDVDSTDKYLHKRRKAISKAMGEEISPDECESIIETLAELSPALLMIDNFLDTFVKNDNEIIVTTHVTSPFLKKKTITNSC